MARTWAVVFGSVAVAVVGCATAIHGTDEVISVDSVPPGASVTVMPGSLELTTPGQIELDRDTEYELLFELEGYEPHVVGVFPQASGATSGNLLVGGLIGMSVDRSTGAAFRLFPNPAVAHLQPIGSTAEASTPMGAVTFFNDSNSFLYPDSGVISIEVDGRLLGTVDIGEVLEADLPIGTHDVVVAHRDWWLFDDEYALVVLPGRQFVKVWARPMSTRLEAVATLPEGFETRNADEANE